MLHAPDAAHTGEPMRRLVAGSSHAVRRWVMALAWCAAVACAAAGCAKARAAAIPNGPPLAVPPPPARVVAPVQEEPIAALPRPGPEAPVPPPQVTPAARGPAARGTNSPPATPEPRQDPPAAATSSTPAPPPPEPARELRPAPSAGEANEQREVERLLATAEGTLKGVDYRRLNDNNRESYNQVKSLAEQARKALREKNLPYALANAQKAANLAVALAGL